MDVKETVTAVIMCVLTSTIVAPRAVAGELPHALTDHAEWNEFLKEHVKDGRVAYRAIKENPASLSHYLDSIAATSRETLETASPHQRLAFWINAYNAYTIELVVDHYPIANIWDISPFWKRAFGGPFADAFIPLGHLFPGEPRDAKLTLNDIEHEILRKHFNEPRIHFAVVCASTSCPELAAHAYAAEKLGSQLDQAVRGFLADETKNRYNRERHRLELSSILKWFREDFEKDGTLDSYVAALLPAADAQALAAHEAAAEMQFNRYDWSLNDQNH